MMKLPRILHRIYAWLGGYFWTPCPICDQMFGGHEWKDRDGHNSSIPAPSRTLSYSVGICPTCTRAGKGDTGNLVFWS